MAVNEFEKGTFENPYSLEEYEAFAEGTWPGGYVQLEEGEDPEYVPTDIVGNGGNGGCGSDSGCGSGCGEVSGSTDEPHYMVSQGSQIVNYHGSIDFVRKIIVSWSTGIAAPMPGNGSSNADGFVSELSFVIDEFNYPGYEVAEGTWQTNNYWEEPYKAKFQATFKLKIGRVISEETYTIEGEFIIPEIFHITFPGQQDQGCQ